MGFVDAVRKQFPIQPPDTVQLPHQELVWSHTTTLSFPIPTPPVPEVSPEIALATARTIEATETRIEPSTILTVVVELVQLPRILEWVRDGISLPDVVDLLEVLLGPKVHGVVYFKTVEEKPGKGGHRQRNTVVRAFMPEKPGKTEVANIFELLLPILLPPASTEFRDELLFPHELYPFQRAGVKWLFENEYALLADDMGLGKTVQAITAFRALIRRGLALHALVVCPKAVLSNWQREISQWAPELQVMRVHGGQQARSVVWRGFRGKCHVLVVTYDTLRQDRDLVKGRVFDLVVADEVQRVKNPDTDTAQTMRSLEMRRRWGLSGTPLENKLEELVSVFEFIKPGLFKLEEREDPTTYVHAIKRRIEPYMLRRRKEDALPDLPEKKVDTNWIDLTEEQRYAYDMAEKQGVIKLRGTADITVQHVLALIQRLKQICNFDLSSGESCKLDFLRDGFLDKACQGDDKALIVSQYVDTLGRIKEQLNNYRLEGGMPLKPLMYTGDLSQPQRDKVIKEFQDNEDNKLLLLSLGAGGVGLNLTAANYVLHFDRWWNPAVERQAEDRIHRIGQKKTVFVTRLICLGTIEERIEQLLNRKKMLFHDVIDEMADVDLNRLLSEEELFSLFGLEPPRRKRAVTPTPAVRKAPSVPLPNRSVIKPDEPYSNVVRLREVLRSCEKYIWWSDPHFRVRALEELIVTLDPSAVRVVRILSTDDTVDRRAKHDFIRFRDELKEKGISAEWRISAKFAHDRFIVGSNCCYNVPPVGTIFQGGYSEILETSNRPPFDKWWASAKPIEQFVSE